MFSYISYVLLGSSHIRWVGKEEREVFKICSALSYIETPNMNDKEHSLSGIKLSEQRLLTILSKNNYFGFVN